MNDRRYSLDIFRRECLPLTESGRQRGNEETRRDSYELRLLLGLSLKYLTQIQGKKTNDLAVRSGIRSATEKTRRPALYVSNGREAGMPS